MTINTLKLSPTEVYVLLTLMLDNNEIAYCKVYWSERWRKIEDLIDLAKKKKFPPKTLSNKKDISRILKTFFCLGILDREDNKYRIKHDVQSIQMIYSLLGDFSINLSTKKGKKIKTIFTKNHIIFHYPKSIIKRYKEIKFIRDHLRIFYFDYVKEIPKDVIDQMDSQIRNYSQSQKGKILLRKLEDERLILLINLRGSLKKQMCESKERMIQAERKFQFDKQNLDDLNEEIKCKLRGSGRAKF